MVNRKFVDLVHYICWKCEDPKMLGATKLNKIPWYIDVLSYQGSGQSVTGEAYVKRQNGPVPKNILAALDELKQAGKIAVREPRAQFQPREFFALTEPDMSAFSPNEVKLFDIVIDDICKDFTAGGISLMTHDQVWAAADFGEEIPLFATLASLPDGLDEEDMTWADGIVKGVTATQEPG